MLRTFRRWLADAPIQDSVQRQLAPVLQTILIASLLILIVANGQTLTLEGLLPMLAVIIIFGLIRYGYFNAALVLIIVALTLGMVQSTIIQGGATLLISVLPVTIAGLLLNRLALFLILSFNIIGAILAMIARSPDGSPPTTSLVIYALVMVVFSFLIHLFASTLRRALTESVIRERDLMTAWRTLDLQANRLADANRDLEKEIKERKQIAAQLDEQREWFQVTLSSIGDAVITADTANRVTFMNVVAEELTGWRQQDALGTDIEQVFHIVHETTLEKVENPLTRVFTEGMIVTLENHTVLIDKHGKHIPINDSGAPIRDNDGKIIGAVLIFRDVTEQRKTRLALEESEHRFRVMADCAPVMIWVSDAQRRYIYFNKPWLEFTRRTLEQELGFGWSENIHPEDYDRCLEIYTTAFDQRQEFRTDYRLRRADGEYRWVLDHGLPRFKANGEFDGYIGSVVDITERKLAYQLEREARIQAEEADKLKMKFLAMISHELRTPLTTIKGFTSTLLAEDVEWSDAERHEFISIMDEEANRLTGLVEQLLDVSRLQAGNLSIDPFPQDLNAILNSAMPQLKAVTIQHDLTTDFPTGLPIVLADAERVIQIIVNLVSNAVKFSPAYTTITVTARHEGDFVRIAVCDKGVGIPESEREQVFEAFRQIDRKLSPLGAGLGLAICKGLIEAHGGQITIADNDGLGTCVSFTLPVIPTS